MAQLIANRRDIDFVLFEQFDTEALTEYEKYVEFNRKTINLIINEAKNFAIKELLPANSEGDRQGVSFDAGVVRVPECYHRPYKLYLAGEWTSLDEPVEQGGQGMPPIVARAAYEYLVGGSYNCVNYANFGHGTGKMIQLYGTEEQKTLFVKKLYKGEWTGGMSLTEAKAGSDVGALTTEAVKSDDGTYSITGTKIFISNGEHDLSENIISPVLARMPGSPPGAKGISIFIVPKYWVNQDGSLGERNDIVCTGIEEKMGHHGSSTCTMAMGSKGRCKGLLLGKENEGMKIMFQMMNEARLGVGFQAFTLASAAYQYALNYAKERTQGKSLDAGKDHNAPSVPIIRHPDVRRMLMWMKAHVDGLRSFVYYIDHAMTRQVLIESEEDRRYYQRLIDLFTPVLKAFSAQRSFDVCVQAIQIYGGYGYTKEYPVEQLLRDCKITSIYEGTDGIQSIDLLGRKILLDGGKAFGDFIKKVSDGISIARKDKALIEMAGSLEKAVNRLSGVCTNLAKTADSNGLQRAFAHSFPFLMAMGDVIMGWMLLWRASVAAEKLNKGVKSKDEAFYQGQITTADFFIHTVLPETIGKMVSIDRMSAAAVEMEEDGF